MSNNKSAIHFWKAVEPILRKFLENIENPFVWTPLGLFVLCILAYPITKFKELRYLSILFLLLTFITDWAGRWQNRQTPVKPKPQQLEYYNELKKFLSHIQYKAVEMLSRGKTASARTLINKNFQAINEALKSFPDDADFHALKGYTLKDIYQSSKNLLSASKRQEYLSQARKSFEHALKIDPNNASIHNGMGNVLFFEGKFDEAIKEHETALELTGGNYPAAEHDRQIVTRVKNGEIPFDF